MDLPQELKEGRRRSHTQSYSELHKTTDCDTCGLPIMWKACERTIEIRIYATYYSYLQGVQSSREQLWREQNELRIVCFFNMEINSFSRKSQNELRPRLWAVHFLEVLRNWEF